MTSEWEKFISEFHNINGVTIAEKQRNFQYLLRRNTVSADEQQLVIDQLTPKSYLESLWHVDVLIHFKKTTQLLEILKSGNEAFVARIIKQQWFFQEVFNNVRAEGVVNDFLPFMSYSVKVKLLKKLIMMFPEEKMDAVFDCILQRYGLSMASKVISGCSAQKISNILNSYEVVLTTNQLKAICRKQSKLIMIYFERCKQQQSERIFEDCFLNYLAQRDPVVFWAILEKCDEKCDLKLGRRVTKRVLTVKKDDIVALPNKYIKYFRQETLVRDLNKQGNFKLLYRNLFPTELEAFDKGKLQCNELLKYYPKRNRYQFYADTFRDVIKEDIWSKTSYVDDSFLPLIGDEAVREKWAQLKFMQNDNKTYIQYYKMKTCIALVKKKINVIVDAKERAQFLEILVKGCALNSDYRSLLQVLKYYCVKHRNDDSSTRDSFLCAIEKHIKTEGLTEAHWNYIHEIVTIQNSRKKYCGTHTTKLRVKYLAYLCQNEHPEDEITSAVSEYIKDELASPCYYFSAVKEIGNAELERKVLLRILEQLPQHISSGIKRLLYGLTVEITRYNNQNPSGKIVVYKDKSLLSILKQVLGPADAEDSSKLYPILICKLKRNKMDNELLDLYWDHVQPRLRSNPSKVLNWFLRHDPRAVVKSFDKIMSALVEQLDSMCYPSSANKAFGRIWPMFKLYSHLKLDEMAVKYISTELDKEDADEIIVQGLVTPLSVICTPESYINIIETRNLTPATAKKSTEVKKIVKKFSSGFKNIKDTSKCLPFLVDKYCRAGYIGPALAALYSASYRCPQNELKVFIDKLCSSNVVEVKKHALSLSRCVSDQRTVLDVLEIFEVYSYTSLNKNIFLGMLRYFSKNPSEQIFNKLIYIMMFLSEINLESMLGFVNIQIPRSFYPRYVQKVWPVLEMYKFNDNEGSPTIVYRILSSVLELIDKQCIQNLPLAFCKYIIDAYALKNAALNKKVCGTFPFMIKFLMYCDQQMANFDFVFDLLSKYKTQVWHNHTKAQDQGGIYEFFNSFYTQSCEEEVNADFVILFYNYWERVFTPAECFEEYVLLNVLLFKKKSVGDLEACAKEIVLFSERVLAQFGQIVFPKFVIALAKSSDFKGKDRYQLLSHMLKFKTTSLNCILVMELRVKTGDFLYKDRGSDAYQHINSMLEQHLNDPSVQIYYNLSLKM